MRWAESGEPGRVDQTKRLRCIAVVEFQKKAARRPRGFVRGGGFRLPSILGKQPAACAQRYLTTSRREEQINFRLRGAGTVHVRLPLLMDGPFLK